jgi:hypothetical protein
VRLVFGSIAALTRYWIEIAHQVVAAKLSVAEGMVETLLEWAGT